MRNLVVTIFVIFGVVLVVLGYLWLSSRLGGGSGRVITVLFNDVAGLKPGDRVDVLGVTKGRVTKVELTEDNRVKVTFSIPRDVKLTRSARFAIRSLSYLGSDRYVAIEPGNGELATDTIQFIGVNEVLDLETTFLRLDQLMQDLAVTELVPELRQTREEVFQIINKGFGELGANFGAIDRNIERLSTNVETLVIMLNQESTARKLLTSPELYDELLKTSRQLQALIADLRAHPEKYLRLKLFK